MMWLAIYSALSTLAAVYFGWCAVKRWRERELERKALAMSDSVCRELQQEVDGWKETQSKVIDIGLRWHACIVRKEAELTHAVEWLNAANDRVRELEESIVEEAKQTILKMRPDVKQVAFVRHRGRVKPRPYVDEFEECNDWEDIP